MSVETLAVVLHHSRAKGTDKVVMLGIANHDGDGGAWPSVATLSKYAGVTARNVQQAIRRLVEAGELVVHQRAGGTALTRPEFRPNLFEVLVQCPPNCDRSKNHKLDSLWINPLSPATPPVASDTTPLSLATPPPLSPATPEPSIEPSTEHEGLDHGQLQDTREASCFVCSLPLWDCRQRERVSGHTFTPRRALRAVDGIKDGLDEGEGA